MRQLRKRPKAILFDMDGVIVDSMPYHFIAWYEALRPWGVRVNCIDVYEKEGEKWEKTLHDLLTRSGIPPTKKTVNAIFRERERIFRKYFKRYIYRGVEDFILCLKQSGYRLGLVTGTLEKEMKKILPKRIRGYFDCIVPGDHVPHGKPNPDPYLKAAKMLNLAPKDCVVIENAPFGIRSARSAGMYCFAITTSLPREYLKADTVVDTLDEITGMIDRVCKVKKK